MGNLRAQRRRITTGDAGASLVEFALLAPLLFTILLGTITGGITMSRQNSVENAVRESTRFGAVYPNSDLGDYLEAVLAQVESAATGDLADGVAGKRICVAFIDGDDVATRIVKNGATAGAEEADDCFDDSLSGQARVQVRAERTSDIEVIFYTHEVTLSSQSATRYER